MTNSLTRTARGSVLAVTLGVMGALGLPAQAAITWPGASGDPDNPEPSRDYRKGYNQGKKACADQPIDCEVMLEDVVANPGWGETEPNDHMAIADRLKPGVFYKGNTLDEADQDWYYLNTTQPNRNLVVSFMGDQADYTNTAGWLIHLHDPNGNVIATFDSLSSGEGNVFRYADDLPVLPKTPKSLAKVFVHTLGNPGRYYLSVVSKEEEGVQRAYHIAAMISDSNQLAPQPDSNFHDAETEVNDLQELADKLRSNVPMFGTFGRRLSPVVIPPSPPQFEIQYFYDNCDPMDIATIPPGLDSCECSDPLNPVSGYTCVAEQVKVPGTGNDRPTYVAAYEYDTDWFFYRSEGNEQLRFELCAKAPCDFARVHLRVLFINDSMVIVDTPIQPGQTFDFGVVQAGTYYFKLSPEPTDGPVVDPESGVHTVDDLTGPYNFMLRSTGLPTNGGE
ncbi:MAG TPA: hypothetical protein EYP90_11240 [Chromatiaceae bacterium]|nr:hypothetical protein [Chromatiaceae bacterium]